MSNFRNWTIVILLVVNVSLLITIFFLISNLNSLAEQNSEFTKKFAENPQYDLLSPNLAWQQVETYSRRSDNVLYYQLKSELLNSDVFNRPGRYSVYVENLKTGSSFGIRENDVFIPASLLKVPVMVSVVKKIELEEYSTEDRLVILKEDYVPGSGILTESAIGQSYTIKELLEIMMKYSDNTATMALTRLLTDEDIIGAKIALGLPYKDQTYRISPKGYAGMLRSLYFSGYLRESFSQLALSIMLDTEFSSQLPAKLPEGTKIAHKVGFFDDGGYHHDCGIVYLDRVDYIICVMSANTTKQDADYVISEVSKKVYDFMIRV